MEMTAPTRELLSQTIIGNLGFHGLDGYPRVTPVWFNFTGDEIQIASPRNAYKSRALLANPRAVLNVSTSPARPYHVASASGDVEIEVLEEPRRIAFITEMSSRYLGAEGSREYLKTWMRGGHPGPGDLLRLKILRTSYADI